jgi:hypothetical protein
MSAKVKWAILGFVVLGFASPLIYLAFSRSRAAAEYQDQLALARKEGIPTSAAEFAATVRTATPAENAAPLYKQLHQVSKVSPAVDKAVQVIRDGGSVGGVQKLLTQEAETVALLDRATRLPRCWFDRDWSEGAALLLPELANMKFGAKLLVARGWVSASEGHPTQAIEDTNRLSMMARHLREEPIDISGLVGDTVERMAVQSLAEWSLIYREPAYAAALERMVKTMSPPDVKREMAAHLYWALDMIDLMKTPEGRAKIGLHEGGQSGLETAAPLLFNQRDAKTNMVKAFRKYWAGLDNPTKNEAQLQDAISEFNQAMLAYPTAADVFQKLGSGEDDTDLAMVRVQVAEARKQQATALVRALKGAKVAKTIDTSDLRSAFDGKPLSYRFDGRQIILKMSGAPAALEELTLPEKR